MAKKPSSTKRRLAKENAELKEQLAEARKVMTAAGHALRSYQYGNSSTDLAQEMADAIDAIIAPPPEGKRGAATITVVERSMGGRG